MIRNEFPSKYAMANGFVIGSMPQVLQWTTVDGEKKSRVIAEHELTDLLKAMMAPVKPYGSICSSTGGAQKSLRGNYHFFKMDQNRIGGVIHQLNKSRIGEHIYCVLCGRMTVDQKRIIRKWSTLDTQLFIDIMTWFVQQSGHPGFKDTSIPEKCTQPLLFRDSDTNNNTNISVDENFESSYEGGTYYFSLAQDPSEATSVYGSSKRFALGMFQHSAPTLLAFGGTYDNITDVPIENILPFALPFWYWRTKNETKSASIPSTLHSVISAVITNTIHGGTNHSSDESHLQQTNVISQWCEDMQIYCEWCFIG